MFFRSATARNEFVDPAPQDQSRATLVLNEQRIVCRLVEVSIGGFTVMIPRATAWVGEPDGRLVTHDASYDVRVLKQESRYEGFEVKLQRIDKSDDSLPSPQRWIIHGSRCCAIGLIFAITYCYVAAPGGVTRGPAHRVTWSGLVDYWTSVLPRRDVRPNDRLDSADLPAIQVSLGHDGTDDVGLEVSTVSRGSKVAATDRDSLVRTAAATADTQRSRPMNSTTLPWLLPPGTSTPLTRCRMAAAAETDLQMFAACLRSLNPTEAADATRSLRETLASIASSPASIATGIPSVRRIRSTDADVYFRIVDGEAELLRILPVELPDTAPGRSPSAAAGQSPRR
jgi:plasmid stabilization system protein ParE